MAPGKRGRLSAAVMVVCAVCAATVLAIPGGALAAPAPDPSPSGPPASVTVPDPVADAAPATDAELEAVRTRLEELYHDAAVATDAYNAAEELADQQSAEIVALAKRIVQGEEKLAELKERAGAAARAQYRTGGLPPEAQLILSDDPRQFLDGAGRILQGERATDKTLAELQQTQDDLELYAKDAAAGWDELEANRKAKDTARGEIEKQISAAEKLESQLAKEEKERLAELERQAAARAQTAWVDTGILDELPGGTASAEGRRAVAWAKAQLGKPYEWGAEGPDTFDCSGLTSEAWAAAGTPIPRTSQEQWRQLPRVDLAEMRPGDLIIYNSDASHVAMYVGDGAMVHSPRPGRTVTIAGAGSMPILGVVRPGG
ncbi:NlpC/P60 family protein [Streptomyces sp. NPDC093252]|uniref:C40 family peptidase n=1 Tax=Streptomyces sp. NPDC093252 TaxID=3154980 RepID=UPI0034288550